MSKVVLEKREEYQYFVSPTFRPTTGYPEYPFEEIDSGTNAVYDMVRSVFHRMALDEDNYGTADWNPLKTLIEPGNTVLIKPNFVMDYNPSGEGTDCLYTQPSVVAAVVDYVFIALQGKGRIVLGDAPMQECDFPKLMAQSGYDRLCAYYQGKCGDGLSFELVDFRGVTSTKLKGVYHYKEHDQAGVVVDLGDKSAFSELTEGQYKNLRITNYDPEILRQHHCPGRNEYCVSRYVLDADVIINMPKPKTHRKAGVTIAMKNLVGINARKEYLPHHTNGAYEGSGDEYLKKSCLKKMMDFCLDRRNHCTQADQKYRLARMYHTVFTLLTAISCRMDRDPYYEGSWYGNRTISRTIVDLNKILFYADKGGIMRDSVQRKYLIVADMIVSGQKEGPVAPSALNVGMIAAGTNPVCFDEAIATLMGAKINRIDTLRQARNTHGGYKLVEETDQAYLVSNDVRYDGKTIPELAKKDLFYFVPTTGWMEAFYPKED